MVETRRRRSLERSAASRWTPTRHAAKYGDSVTLRSVDYRLDSEDRIVSVGAEWLAFARANAGAELEPGAVLGRRLWDFIADRETRHLYGLIFATARLERRNVTIPFRCDSPTSRRYMELAIEPLADDALDLSSMTIREEPRSYVALLDPSVPRSDDLLVICSWCKQVLVPRTGWVEVEIAIRRLDLFASAQLPNLSHGMCSACESKLDWKIES
jgi:hypothetical protein